MQKPRQRNLKFVIDGNNFTIEVPDSSKFAFGEDTCLSKDFNDITKLKDWYEKGFDVVEANSFLNIQKTKAKLSGTIYQLCKEVGANVDKDNFNLVDYHKYVSIEQHAILIKKTRDLSPKDFDFDIDKFLTAAKKYFNRILKWEGSNDYNPKIIIRINMPQSNNFNPAHKDIYQVYDETKKIPPMVNIWIPICGVNNGVGLPLCPGSHLINESMIYRTQAGSIANGKKFNVNCIEHWDSRNDLVTISPSQSQMLVFSSFLIHGLARNSHHDMTRISLEFRLFG